MDPIERFAAWLEEARAAVGIDADAVALATSSTDGRPSVRIVLYRGMSGTGLRFFTNYESRKGRELAANPQAAMCFYWPALARQVRIEGQVERLSNEESDEYFRLRPRGSQLSAACSPQSSPIASLAELLVRRDALARESGGGDVARPSWWGGYRLNPESIEFWISGEDRLHERVLFTRRGDDWQEQRIAP